jgi:D-psicose/D-tagatose/L-ribulose 3-epimerase
MKLAISGIALPAEVPYSMLSALSANGVEGLVLAPTMVWDDAPLTDVAIVSDYRKRLEDVGLAVFGLQSLAFGRQDVALFGESDQRRNLTEHLKRQAELAGRLGAESMIFGSPALRQGNSLSSGLRLQNAKEVFTAVAQTASEEGTVLCVEPLSGYGNDFIKTTREGVELVKYVDHSGFGLHLDSAAIIGAQEGVQDLPYAMRQVGIRSFDASAPDLAPLSQDNLVPHAEMAQALKQSGYLGFISLEMRYPGDLQKVLPELDIVRQAYIL